jgi:NAD(P)-dependent dehydrogenase (short-subunit alcohol dehydrogenase family)
MVGKYKMKLKSKARWNKSVEKLDLATLYNMKDKVVAITGAAGVLGGEIACALVELGTRVAIMDMRTELSAEHRQRLAHFPEQYIVIQCDVLNRESVMAARQKMVQVFQKVDSLINAAGGNHPKATTSADLPFFNITPEAFNWVMQLNLSGTVLPCQVFGEYFAGRDAGNILNISSMNAFRPLTRIPAYSAAKAAVSNFTQWLAVHMAQEYSKNIRVNALAPGFFLTQQNRFLLVNEQTNELTPRGKTIINHTPLGRFGNPGDLLGAVIWLLSPASGFVTGSVIAVDGGFAAFSGV